MTSSESSTDPEDKTTGPASVWVVGLDGSDNARRALSWAGELALDRDVTLQVVSAWQYPYLGLLPTVGSAIPAIDENMGQAIEREIVEIAGEVAAETGVRIETTLVVGTAAQVLLDALDHADLAVVGSRGRGGFPRLMLGSVSHQLATHARRPTIIVPPHTNRSGLGRVIIGVDGSDNSIAAMRWAHAFAPEDSELVALGVWEPTHIGVDGADGGTRWATQEAAEQVFDTAVARVESELGVPARFSRVFESGHAREQLLRSAAEADLLVVGERGHRGFLGGVLGSVTTWVIHHLACPTAVIPGGRNEH